MPKCYVSFCDEGGRSGSSEPEHGGKKSYPFPLNNETALQRWRNLLRVPEGQVILKDHRVCWKHFSEVNIITAI